MSVRVRFAPSPTGSLHLGSALTAVANWLFARQQDGEVVLRIDDTDEQRAVDGAEQAIEQDLGWLGLGWDEGPLRQSERRQRHLEQAAAAEGAHTRDGAVWLSSPGLPEFVIVRSDGRPTYRWASAVDDADMGITHVIRGNDHLPNAALQIAAVRSLGAEPPQYLHHAMVPALRGAHTLAEAGDLVACVTEAPLQHPLPELATIRERYPDRLSEQDARALVDELRSAGVPLRDARMALTGREQGPELWAVLAALPRDEAIRRAA